MASAGPGKPYELIKLVILEKEPSSGQRISFGAESGKYIVGSAIPIDKIPMQDEIDPSYATGQEIILGKKLNADGGVIINYWDIDAVGGAKTWKPIPATGFTLETISKIPRIGKKKSLVVAGPPHAAIGINNFYYSEHDVWSAGRGYFHVDTGRMIPNYGNTCFINSVIIMLRQIRELQTDNNILRQILTGRLEDITHEQIKHILSKCDILEGIQDAAGKFYYELFTNFCNNQHNMQLLQVQKSETLDAQVGDKLYPIYVENDLYIKKITTNYELVNLPGCNELTMECDIALNCQNELMDKDCAILTEENRRMFNNSNSYIQLHGENIFIEGSAVFPKVGKPKTYQQCLKKSYVFSKYLVLEFNSRNQKITNLDADIILNGKMYEPISIICHLGNNMIGADSGHYINLSKKIVDAHMQPDYFRKIDKPAGSFNKTKPVPFWFLYDDIGAADLVKPIILQQYLTEHKTNGLTLQMILYRMYTPSGQVEIYKTDAQSPKTSQVVKPPPGSVTLRGGVNMRPVKTTCKKTTRRIATNCAARSK